MRAGFLHFGRRWIWIGLWSLGSWWLVVAGWGQSVDGVEVVWKPRFDGVQVAEMKATVPRRIRGVALRINLRAEGVSFFATPANGEKPGETDAQLTSAFLAEHKLQAAINGAPFDVVHENPGEPQDVRGLLVSEGMIVSKSGRTPALMIDKNNGTRIVDNAAQVSGEVWTAVGGFAVVLRDGQPTGRGDTNVHPRTAVGISQDGAQMYWLVVDGRQLGHSSGVTTAELAGMLKLLGAWDGINLDGGGTSTLVVAGADAAPQILNRPVHGGIPGQERHSGCHLGLRARALPAASGAVDEEMPEAGG